jgi:hypothetical protein
LVQKVKVNPWTSIVNQCICHESFIGLGRFSILTRYAEDSQTAILREVWQHGPTLLRVEMGLVPPVLLSFLALLSLF